MKTETENDAWEEGFDSAIKSAKEEIEKWIREQNCYVIGHILYKDIQEIKQRLEKLP